MHYNRLSYRIRCPSIASNYQNKYRNSNRKPTRRSYHRVTVAFSQFDVKRFIFKILTLFRFVLIVFCFVLLLELFGSVQCRPYSGVRAMLINRTVIKKKIYIYIDASIMRIYVYVCFACE